MGLLIPAGGLGSVDAVIHRDVRPLRRIGEKKGSGAVESEPKGTTIEPDPFFDFHLTEPTPFSPHPMMRGNGRYPRSFPHVARRDERKPIAESHVCEI